MALDGYVSPILRCAVFRQMHPGAQIEFKVVPIDDAFPQGFRAPAGGTTSPVSAIVCTAYFPDGTWVEAAREIDEEEQGRDKKWRPAAMTPEYYAKIETKAMGRMLTKAGIPQKDFELRDLMRWLVALNGRPSAPSAPPIVAGVNTDTGEVVNRAAFAAMPDDHVDDPDADDTTVTPSMELAEAIQALPPVLKGQLAKWAREEMQIANVMNVPDEHVDAVDRKISQLLEEST